MENNLNKKSSDEASQPALRVGAVSGSFNRADSPMKIACKDISEYLRSQNLRIIDSAGDVWVVTPERLVNKDTTKLNIELGIHRVNKTSANMSRKSYR